MHIFFSVGEPSGDLHAAKLAAELKQRVPGLECSGFGGPLMEAAGCRLIYRLTDLAVMGILPVIPLLFKFLRLIWQARRSFQEQRPDAVVLVDFPGFNWWIARSAKKLGIPVIYYLPPQLWAWAPWRVASPELGGKIIDYGDPQLLRAPRDPPVETRKVDQHHRVGPLLLEGAPRLPDQPQEFEQQRDHRQDPHHRQIGQPVDQPATGRFHQRSAKPRALQPRHALFELGGQFRGVQVAAGLSDGKENVHARWRGSKDARNNFSKNQTQGTCALSGRSEAPSALRFQNPPRAT